MKHLTRLAAILTAAVIVALPLGAQTRGQSSHHSSHSRPSSGISGSSSSRSGASVHGNTGSDRRGNRSVGNAGGSSISGNGGSSSGSVSGRRGGTSHSFGSGDNRGKDHGSNHSDNHGVRPGGGNNPGSARPDGNRDVRPGSRPDGNTGGSHGVRPDGAKPGDKPGIRPGDTRPGGTGHHPGGEHGPRPGYGTHHPGGEHGPRPGYGTHHPGGQVPGPGVRVNPGHGHHPGGYRPGPVHGTPSHFSRSGHHGYGRFIYTLPSRYELLRYHGFDYYLCDNIWYRYHSGRYWVCRPPFGYVFTPLADAVLTACTFAYFIDNAYALDRIDENASIIASQNAAIAANNEVLAGQEAALAANAAKVGESASLAASLGLVQSFAATGAEYYYNDGVFYMKEGDGYTVIVPPAGALVENLPEDFEVVDYGGVEYYKVDDTLYRTVVIDGKAWFEVLGQLK